MHALAAAAIRLAMLPALLTPALLTPALAQDAPALQKQAETLFQEALRLDLDARPGQAEKAFALHARAAALGLPQAQFNVAVMLDSGRGTRTDLGAAATWYARAAAHGNARAAFNLGQLYEAGEGVPQNPQLARAWFGASGLPAARARLAAMKVAAGGPAAGTLAAPVLVAPAAGAALVAGLREIELVWTAAAQAEPVRFFVEVRAMPASGSREIFAGYADVSSLRVTLPPGERSFAWRVTTVARSAGRYAASDWRPLTAP